MCLPRSACRWRCPAGSRLVRRASGKSCAAVLRPPVRPVDGARRAGLVLALPLLCAAVSWLSRGHGTPHAGPPFTTARQLRHPPTGRSLAPLVWAAACLCLLALAVAARCYVTQRSASSSQTSRLAITTPDARNRHTRSADNTHRDAPDYNATVYNTSVPAQDGTTRLSQRLSVQEVPEAGQKQRALTTTTRPMPSAHDHPNHKLSGGEKGGGGSGSEASQGEGSQSETSRARSRVLVVATCAGVLTVTLGLVTCVVSHYRGGGGNNTAAADDQQHINTAENARQNTHWPTHTAAPMLSVVSATAAAGVGGMERLHVSGAASGVRRELAAQRDRQVRLHSVHHDLQIDLPPSIQLPDGEEMPYGSSNRLQIRDAEQESEIYQKCIRPPPNRTVFESESPPPYRSSSAGLLGSLGSSSSAGSDWSAGSTPLVVRCHSMSSTSKPSSTHNQKTDFIQRTVKIFTGKKTQTNPAPTLPPVVVPSRSRRVMEHQQNRTKPNI